MYKLCLGLSLAAVAMLVSCSGDNGSSVSDLVELPKSPRLAVLKMLALANPVVRVRVVPKMLAPANPVVRVRVVPKMLAPANPAI